MASADRFAIDEDSMLHIGNAAATVGYQFTGIVIQPGTTYGEAIARNAPVSGSFVYDTSSLASTSVGDSTDYRQQRVGGFTANFGELSTVAHDFKVSVTNNRTQPSGVDFDFFAVTFDSRDHPAVPIEVNDVSENEGFVRLNFVGMSNVFADESLPESISLGSFFDTFSFLGDSGGGIDVGFLLLSLTEIDVDRVGLLTNDEDADGDPLSVISVNDEEANVGQQITLSSGALLTLNADGSFDYDPNGQFDGLRATETATDTFSYTVSDGAGGMDEATVTVTINGPPLQVESVQANGSRVDLLLNGDIDPASLNLYDGGDEAEEAADVTLVGASVGEVAGSLHWDAASQTLSFIKSGGELLPDTYTLTVSGENDGLLDVMGRPLDGDEDRSPGGNFVDTVEVVADDAVTVSIPDFARGPGQDVDHFPLETDVILPVFVSDGFDARAIDLTIEYDPALLAFDDQQAVRIGRDAENTEDTDGVFLSDAVADTSTPGIITIAGYTFEPLLAGRREFLQLVASVPADAPLGSSQLIRITSLSINEGNIEAKADDAIQAVGYFGDVTGSSSFSGLDASSIARVAVGLDTGFDDFPLFDPVLIGDVTGDGSISALDAAFVARKAAGLDQDQIPDIPDLAPRIVPPPSADQADRTTEGFAEPMATFDAFAWQASTGIAVNSGDKAPSITLSNSRAIATVEAAYSTYSSEPALGQFLEVDAMPNSLTSAATDTSITRALDEAISSTEDWSGLPDDALGSGVTVPG